MLISGFDIRSLGVACGSYCVQVVCRTSTRRRRAVENSLGGEGIGLAEVTALGMHDVPCG